MKAIIVLALLFNIMFGMDIINIKDMFGRDIRIKENKRIVCLGPGALRLAGYLKLQERIAGIEKLELKYDLRSPYRAAFDKKEINSLSIVSQGGPGKMPNLETLVTLGPDIIFTSFLSKEQVQLIQDKTKIPVVALSYGATYGGAKKQSKLEAVKNSLKLMGKITGKNKRAQELVEFMELQEKQLAKIRFTGKKVYIGGIGYKGAQGITSTESAYPPFELLNIKNELLKDKKGHFFINKEALLSYNPDIIFLDYLGKKIVKEELVNDKKLYGTIEAFKQKQVFWLYPYNFYNTNMENIFINSWKIASYLGLDIDLKAKEEEIYKKFLGEKGFEAMQKIKPYKI